jgi:putative NIF3 family GTP cyclohydrolase 1 type 2
MKACEIVEFFLSQVPHIDRATTVDRVIIGDPNRPIQKVLVTWMPSLAAVKAAIDGKYDLLLTHEPTFYDHRDYRDYPTEMPKVAIAMHKKKLIEDAGLTIVRIHDVWDLIPDVGIPFAWAKFLGLDSKPVQIDGGNYMHRYDITPITLDALAKEIAGRTRAIGESAIQVFGRGDQLVSRIGIGTGCATVPATFQRMGCDVSVVSDDGTLYWKQLQQAEDEGHPFIRVHHGTSEEPGMVTLTKFINDNLPAVHADHLPHRPFYRMVTA